MQWDIANDAHYAMEWRKQQVAFYLSNLIFMVNASRDDSGYQEGAAAWRSHVIEIIAAFITTELDSATVQEVVNSAIDDVFESGLTEKVDKAASIYDPMLKVLVTQIFTSVPMKIGNLEAVRQLT